MQILPETADSFGINAPRTNVSRFFYWIIVPPGVTKRIVRIVWKRTETCAEHIFIKPIGPTRERTNGIRRRGKRCHLVLLTATAYSREIKKIRIRPKRLRFISAEKYKRLPRDLERSLINTFCLCTRSATTVLHVAILVIVVIVIVVRVSKSQILLYLKLIREECRTRIHFDNFYQVLSSLFISR